MIFVFDVVAQDGLFRFLEILLEVLHPLGDYSQNSIGLNKEDPVGYLFLGIQQCIFGYLPPN